MISDANDDSYTHAPNYDVCIVGSGPAGITLALELAAKGKRICLLEAGGLDLDWDSQELYDGDIVGTDYPSLDTTRLRYFGGSTGHWGGQCFQFDTIDYAVRDHVPMSGWPIGYDDLARYKERAAEIVEIHPFGRIREPLKFGDDLDRLDQRWSSDRGIGEIRNIEPIRFGDHYRQLLADAEGIDVVLNANVIDVSLDGAAGRVTALTHLSYSGIERQVTSGDFVLAMGGVEISRFLLIANRRNGDRLGNQGGMVGRCFMEHPVLVNGSYFITKRLYSHSRYWEFERLFRRQKPELVVSPSLEYQEREKVLNAAVHLDRIHRRPLEEDELAGNTVLQALEFDRDYFFVGHCWVVGEQSPNPDSRIMLSEERDKLGQPKAMLDWQLLPIDMLGLRAASLLAAQALIKSGMGRMQLNKSLWEKDADPEYDISYHHMGGVRMSPKPDTGVVDADCRVHGVGNLYVAGSGVFPTSGHANPTFTIVQLALRLADKLAASV